MSANRVLDIGTLARTFVEITDTLIGDFDVAEVLSRLAERCVEVLDVAAAGLMLAAPGATSE